MIQTLSQFNSATTGEAVDADALREEFYASGFPAIDALWSKPHRLLRDRQALAAKLSWTAARSGFETTVEFAAALIQRLPYALHARNTLSNGDTASLISTCVEYFTRRPGNPSNFLAMATQNLMFGSTDLESIGGALGPRFAAIAEVIAWHRRHIDFGDRLGQRSVFIVHDILQSAKHVSLGAANRHAVQNLYDVLEETLDGCHPHQVSWFEVHRHLAAALGHDVLASNAYAKARNLPELTARYKQLVAQDVGQLLAEALFSQMQEHSPLEALGNAIPEEQRPILLAQLVKARRYYPSDLARHGKRDPWSVLCVSLNPSTYWSRLFDFARRESAKPLPPKDDDIAELIKTLADDGCLESKSILERALELCRDNYFPKTLAALSNYRDAEQEWSPFDYSARRWWLAPRMLLLTAIRYVRRLPS